MKKLILVLVLGLIISIVGYNINEQRNFETMTIVSVGYNDHSVYGYSKGFWEYWANNSKTGDSFHGVSFHIVSVGQKVRVRK